MSRIDLLILLALLIFIISFIIGRIVDWREGRKDWRSRTRTNWQRRLGAVKCPLCLHFFYPQKTSPKVYAVFAELDDLPIRVPVCESCAPFVRDCAGFLSEE